MEDSDESENEMTDNVTNKIGKMNLGDRQENNKFYGNMNIGNEFMG
jgi:hypothetical protein